nr:solute carrier family 23 protein [Parabacteroides distasonis]
MTVSKTRDMLVDVARQLFARMGVDNTTMNDIAQASRKGRRTLYTYFKSKNEIYLAVVESELDQLHKMLVDVASKDLPADEKLLTFIYSRLDAVKALVFRNGTLRATFFRDIWRVEKVRKSFDLREVEIIKGILFFNRCKNKYLRMSSIVLGLCIGYAIAFAMGMVDMEAVSSQNLRGFNIPVPFKYGLDFNISSFVAIALIYLITAIEATGDITANSMISGKSIEGEGYLRRVSGGVLADGVNSFISGVFNSFPNSIFAQNNGIIQLTGVASRYVGYYIAGMLILLGLFPVVGVIFSLMPDPVLGGATLLMFGTVAAAGIRIIAAQDINRKATLVLAVSLSLGLGVELMPDILGAAPQVIRGIFSSGITTGGLTAILANLFIRVKEDQTE